MKASKEFMNILSMSLEKQKHGGWFFKGAGA